MVSNKVILIGNLTKNAVIVPPKMYFSHFYAGGEQDPKEECRGSGGSE